MAIDSVVKEIPPVPPAGPGQAVSKNVLQFPQPAAKDLQLPGDQVLLSGTHDARYQQLQQSNERSNAQAGAIRATDRSLAEFGQKIDALKAPLEAIVKNFPPFSADDQTRIKLLRSYSALRKEIDQLTFPPPPDVVRARKAQALPDALEAGATDRQIADHVAKLDAAGAALSDTRAGLAADTASLLQGGGFSQIFSRPKVAETGHFEIPLTEWSAVQKSVQVGRQFANVVSQGVTAASSQFLKGLS